MAILTFDETADAALSILEQDRSKERLVAKIHAALAVLAADPTDDRVRRRRFSNGLWAVELRVGDDEVVILWDGEDLPESVTVRYVGRLPDRH
jgi:hypothetical protein